MTDSDTLLELTRKISSLEASVNRFRAENYKLKVKLEDSQSGKEGAEGGAKKRRPRKTIFEACEIKIVFVWE